MLSIIIIDCTGNSVCVRNLLDKLLNNEIVLLNC